MVDIVNSIDHFNPRLVEGDVCIVGVGALGSAVAKHLAKLGIERFTIIDPDIVESHNLGNQEYNMEDIDKPKAYACANMLERLGVKTVTTDIAKAQNTLYHKNVFVCVDSMAARKEIFENYIYLNGETKFLVEGRMGKSFGSVHAIDMLQTRQLASYRAAWYPDSAVKPEVGSCGRTINLGPTAAIVSALMATQFISLVKQNRDHAHELHVDLERFEFNKVFYR